MAFFATACLTFSGSFSGGRVTTSVQCTAARTLLHTSLASSHFYSSPAGLLGRKRVDIGYEKLKLMMAGQRWRQQAEVNELEADDGTTKRLRSRQRQQEGEVND